MAAARCSRKKQGFPVLFFQALKFPGQSELVDLAGFAPSSLRPQWVLIHCLEGV